MTVLIVVIIVLAGFGLYQYGTKPKSAASSKVELSITIDYANGTSWTPTSPPSLSMVSPSSKTLSITVPPLLMPLTILDPNKGGEVATGYNVNLNLVPVYSLASGATAATWSFAGTANVQVVNAATNVPLTSWGSISLSAPNAVSGQTLDPSGQSQLMFSSTGSFTGTASSTNVFYGLSFTSGDIYNYVFTLNSGATFTITDSLGTTATYTTTQSYSLTWQFEYVSSSTSTAIASLSVVWSGSSQT